MKTHRSFARSVLQLSLVVALGAFAGLEATPALAGGTSTANLDVTASVSNSCTATTTAVAFAAYDGVVTNATSPLDASGKVTVTCTLAGADVTVTLGEGINKDTTSLPGVPVRRMVDGGGHYMSYGLFSDPTHGATFGNTSGTGIANTPTGSAVDTLVFGRIPAGQSLPAGNYTDTVVATVTF